MEKKVFICTGLLVNSRDESMVGGLGAEWSPWILDIGYNVAGRGMTSALVYLSG